MVVSILIFEMLKVAVSLVRTTWNTMQTKTAMNLLSVALRSFVSP